MISRHSFCNSSFWDSSLTWYTDDPDFTSCFERTALVYIPCLVLWLLSPLELYYIRNSKCRDIPWNTLNILKLMLNLVLIVLGVVSLVHALYLNFSDSATTVYPVDICTPVIQILTFVLALVFLLWNKMRGIHTSCSLFAFFFFLSLAGIPQFRSEISAEINKELEDGMFDFVIYMIYFPVVVLSFLLNFVADDKPKVSEYSESKTICPEVNATFFSRITFHWLNSLIWKGFRTPLTQQELFDIRHKNSSARLIPLWEKNIKEAYKLKESKENGYSKSNGAVKQQESRNRAKKPISVLPIIFKTFWRDCVMAVVLKLAGDLASFINPHVLSLLITFVSDKDQPLWKGYLYAVLMFAAGESYSFLFHNCLIVTAEFGVNVRTVLTSTIYKKALRISNSARKASTVGEIVNLMAVDSQRFIDNYPYINLVYSGPFVIILSMVFLWRILGPSALAGLAVMIVLVPINVFVASKVKALQMRQMKYKDERVKLMNEILSGVKVLKLYGWEPSFEEQILAIRNKEMSVLRTASLLSASTNFLWVCSSYLVSLATFGVFVMIDDKNVLTANIAFVATALFNVMKVPIILFPMAITTLIQTIVSMKRIDRYLNAEELDLDSVSHDENKKEPLIIENGVFSWGTEASDLPVLRNINFTVKPGSLVAVVGAVGSGKSSLISAFLGEMDKISGYINTKGELAYVPQQAWIQNLTVKDNILYGSPYDKKKYDSTIEACALKADFEMLPGGDQTEIGEKGINLSGGQKQRVSLARAVYSDCDTYLFDDPLSAVDSHVGKHIFENVIGPAGLLNKKTRVLVTHGVVFLPKVDYIVVLKGGQITESGTFKELLAKKGEFAEFLVEHITETQDEGLEPELEELIDKNPDLKTEMFRRLSSARSSVRSTASRRSIKRQVSVTSAGREVAAETPKDQLIMAETAATGGVKWSVYGAYMTAVGWFLVFSTVCFQILYQACSILSSSWLSTWTDDSSYVNSDGTENSAKRDYYLEVYAAYGVGQLVMNWISAFSLAFGTVSASKGMHFSMLTRILRAPMSFFDTTPTGRIVNRFGKDIDIIDNTLPNNISTILNCAVLVGGTLIVIIYSTPVFAAVVVPVALLYALVQRFYIMTSRQLKRLESVSRSPIYSHFSETVSGSASIRAYKAEERFVLTSEKKVDTNTMSLYLSQISNRWLGIRLEFFGNALVFFAVLFAVLERSTLNAGTVGLSISYALQITSMLNYVIRLASEVEMNVVSVERVKEYADVPQEAAWVVEPRPQREWPDRGTVRFEDYQVRYREGLDLVLRGISFTVHGGEKIGIVGRTGAGKSSLTLCLFRIIEAAGGHIYIDDIDIGKIGLGDLRSKLTIIPQDPVLFSGSLRLNLDPFEAHEDADIWRSLELAHLSEYARSLPAGLSHTITEGGDNLSVGQRQLVCLARALLRKTKVLILDEATAAIDLDTDDLIQETIRKEFRDCTVLTIAHRLNTIMDSDRVLVLDQGMIKEFASPPSLLKDTSTVFYGMAKDAGLVQ